MRFSENGFLSCVIIRVYIGARFITPISPYKANLKDISFSLNIYTAAAATHSTANHPPFVLHSFTVV